MKNTFFELCDYFTHLTSSLKNIKQIKFINKMKELNISNYTFEESDHCTIH